MALITSGTTTGIFYFSLIGCDSTFVVDLNECASNAVYEEYDSPDNTDGDSVEKRAKKVYSHSDDIGIKRSLCSMFRRPYHRIQHFYRSSQPHG